MEWHFKDGPLSRWELRTEDGKVLAKVYEGMLGWTTEINGTMAPGFPSEKAAKTWAKKEVIRKAKQ
jgi:hypothetical protein